MKPKRNGQSSVGSSVSEWICKRHGIQPAPASVAKNEKPRCKWCKSELTLNTWTMSGG